MVEILPEKPIRINNICAPPKNWDTKIKEFWYLVFDLPNPEFVAWKLYDRKIMYNYYILREKYLPLSRL